MTAAIEILEIRRVQDCGNLKALAMAKRGLPVLPIWWTEDTGQCACGAAAGSCKPGKHPIGRLTPKGLTNATLDPRTIESWWRRYPRANVAITTGGASRLLVIDIDPAAGGEASFARLEQEHGALPATVEVVTPRGGRHLYLIVPTGHPLPGNSAGKLGDGIDTRGQGGYVLTPPSVVNGKPYTWSVDSSDRLATAPAWILDLLEADTGGPGRATSPEVWRKLVDGVEAGARNHTITRLAACCSGACPILWWQHNWSSPSTKPGATRRCLSRRSSARWTASHPAR
jgi:hypothetical protein